MIIGVLSDTHDRVDTTLAALAAFRERAVEVVIHAGDICAASTVRAFDGWKSHFVFGNNDGDWSSGSGVGPKSWPQRDFVRLSRAMDEIGATYQHPFATIELAGKSLAWTHGDNWNLLLDLERSDAFDYLFYGHTHVAETHRTGKTTVINPGALHRARPKTCAVLDLASGDVETIVV